MPDTPPPVLEATEDFGLTDADMVESDEPSEDPETEASAPEATPAPADPSASPAPATHEAVDPSTPPVSPTPAATPASPASTPTPYRLKADGTDLPLEGITRLPNGDLVIPAGEVPKLQNGFLANRQQWRETEKARQREIDTLKKQVDPDTNPTTLRNNKVLQGMLDAKRAGINPDTGERYLVEYVDAFEQNLPLYEAQAARDALKAQLQARDEYIQPIQQERQWAQMEPRFGQDLDSTMEQVLLDPANADVDRPALRQALWEQRHELFRPATPEEKQEHGADWSIDDRIFNRELQRYRFFGERLKQERQAVAIQQKNAKALAPSATPPSPSTKSSAPSASERTRPKTKEEWEERLRQFQEEPAL